jgi:hypothetical protein
MPGSAANAGSDRATVPHVDAISAWTHLLAAKVAHFLTAINMVCVADGAATVAIFVGVGTAPREVCSWCFHRPWPGVGLPG